MRVDTRIDKKSTFRYIRSIDFITDRENIGIRQIRVSFKVYSLCAFLVKTRYCIPMKYVEEYFVQTRLRLIFSTVKEIQLNNTTIMYTK